MPRIVHVLGETAGAGAENQALYLLQSLAERGMEVELAYFREGSCHDRFVSLGVPLHHIGARRRLLVDWPRRALVLRNLPGRTPPEIVHTWLFEVHNVGLIAFLDRPETRVVLGHRSGFAAPEGKHLRALRPLRRRIDHVVANSPEGAEVMRRFGIPRDRLSVIANGVPSHRVQVERDRGTVRAELEIPVEAPLFCSVVARPDAAKDLGALFAAFSSAHVQRPDTRLLLVGASASKLEDAGAQVPEGVHAVGFQPRPADFMNAADVIVISSRTEGHSNVADEALMLGLPVVTTTAGGHAELVREAGGSVVPVGDAEALGAAGLALLESPPAPAEVRRIAERKLSMARVADETIQLYEHVLSRDRRRRRRPCVFCL